MRLFPSGRGVGVTDLLQGYAQGPVVVLVALLTQLGDVWFLFFLGGVFYVTGDELPRIGIDRRRGLFVIALVLTYVALIDGLKSVFLLPRPPGAGEPPVVSWLPSAFDAVLADIATGDGYGFPSGHALGTTMVWGGLALTLERGRFRTRLGVAGLVVALVSLSRLVLGVHYLVDVVVGFATGVVVLGVLYWLTERGTDPGRALVVAVVVGLLGLFVDVTFDSVAGIGGAVGGWLVWRGIADATPAHPANRREVVAGFAVMAVAGVLFATVYAFEPPFVLTFLGTALAVGGTVAAPLLGERLV